MVANVAPIVRVVQGYHGEPAVQAPLLDWANGQTLAVSGSSAATTAYGGASLAGGTDTVYYVSSTTNCWITVGASPTAAKSAGNLYIAGNTPPFPVYVPGGQQIAVIQDSATGTLSAVPCVLRS